MQTKSRCQLAICPPHSGTVTGWAAPASPPAQGSWGATASGQTPGITTWPLRLRWLCQGAPTPLIRCIITPGQENTTEYSSVYYNFTQELLFPLATLQERVGRAELFQLTVFFHDWWGEIHFLDKCRRAIDLKAIWLKINKMLLIIIQ